MEQQGDSTRQEPFSHPHQFVHTCDTAQPSSTRCEDSQQMVAFHDKQTTSCDSRPKHQTALTYSFLKRNNF